MKNTIMLLKNRLIRKIILCTLICVFLTPTLSYALVIEYRKLDCVPELQHYSFGGSLLTEEWKYLKENFPVDSEKYLWEKHSMLNTTGPAYSMHPDSVEFEDLKFFEHTCDIGLGIKTRIRSQSRIFRHSMGAGRIMEQIQLFYGNTLLLDSLNEFGCESFSDTECRYYRFGILDIEFFRRDIIITTAARKSDLKKNISDSKDYPKFISNYNCDIYYLDVEISTHWIEEGEEMGIKSSLEPSKIIELPLTREKIKKIIQNEYDSGSPHFKEQYADPIDECYLKVIAWPIG